MSDRELENERLRELFVGAGDDRNQGPACPADDEIWAASRGELPPGRTRTLLDHSLECSACSASFNLAAAISQEARGTQTVRSFSPRRRTVARMGIALAAGIVLAVALMIMTQTGPVPQGLGDRVQTALWRVRSGGDEKLTGDESLRVGDRLFLTVEADAPLHVYVINRDGSGDISALFPVEGAQWTNPLPTGTHRLPGQTSWPHDSWEVSSSGGTESFRIIASLEPLVDLESALAGVDQASPDEHVRGEGPNGVPRDAAGTLSRVIEDLESTTKLGGLVIREIVLKNPR